MDLVYFSQPYRAGLEEQYVREALGSTVWHGDGEFTARASAWLGERTGAASALLTTSCTHALELASILLGLGPGDEVILPSFTFSSTATAVAIRGATPVFVDIDPVTLNLDPEAARAAVTPATKALYVVHYGGVGADMAAIGALADAHGLAVVEDNAHGLGGSLDGRPLGSFGTFAAQSWHDTKNVTCGEGGALLVNDPAYVERAEIVREKGTNRSRFLRGQVDKYTWVDQGSSYLPSDLLAALLMAQFERFDDIQAKRMAIWRAYAEHLPEWAAETGVRTMHVPDGAEHPAHLYYVELPEAADQQAFISHLRARDIVAAFHYQPLDASPAGVALGRTPFPCDVTRHVSERLVRLPLHAGMTQQHVERVVDAVCEYRPR